MPQLKNLDEARILMRAEADPVARNLQKLAVGKASLLFQLDPRLVVADLDLAFVARLARALYDERKVIEGVLRGDSLEEATGWFDPYEE